MIEWVTGLRPEWWEAVGAWLAIVAFWTVTPFAASWVAGKLQRRRDRAAGPTVASLRDVP